MYHVLCRCDCYLYLYYDLSLPFHNLSLRFLLSSLTLSRSTFFFSLFSLPLSLPLSFSPSLSPSLPPSLPPQDEAEMQKVQDRFAVQVRHTSWVDLSGRGGGLTSRHANPLPSPCRCRSYRRPSTQRRTCKNPQCHAAEVRAGVPTGRGRNLVEEDVRVFDSI